VGGQGGDGVNYETDQDRDNEARAAIEFAARFNLRNFKIGYNSSIDRALLNHAGVIVAFAEIKCHLTDKKYRFNDPRFGGGYKLREDKFRAAHMLNMVTHCPVHLVVEFDDALAYLDVTRVTPQYGYRIGRRDRGDPNDDADAVLFAWPAFTLIRHDPLKEQSAPRITSVAERGWE
jgi:hypothetical protein